MQPTCARLHSSSQQSVSGKYHKHTDVHLKQRIRYKINSTIYLKINESNDLLINESIMKAHDVRKTARCD